MIFDSLQMELLRAKYLATPPYELPKVVYIDRFDEFSSERVLLERSVTSVSPKKQKDWLGRLINSDDNQHVGAWFEIMLYSWLKENYSIQTEPMIGRRCPDFLIDDYEKPIVIEARAFLGPAWERARRVNQNRIHAYLHEIPLPFNINLKTIEVGASIDKDILTQAVIKWLSTENASFSFDDKNGNVLEFEKRGLSGTGHLDVMSISPIIQIDPLIISRPLKEKSDQHQAVLEKGYPYVIALYLESRTLGFEKVAEAWLGKIQILFDRSTGVIEEKTDGTGASFHNGEVVNTNVSGILVFRSVTNLQTRGRDLEACYIENPFAKNPIPPEFFPVKSRCEVINRTEGIVKMAWR